MFNLQGSEIIIVLLLALVVLGPEKLPDAMRKMGQFYAELKKMSTGFQNEFRAAVDEPMREIRDTANVLRDSADFTKLKQGERDEKPKSAEMAPADASPTDDLPTFETPTDSAADEPELAADSKPAPFSGVSSAAPRQPPVSPPPVSPTPFPPFRAESPPPEVDTAEQASGPDDAGHGEDPEPDVSDPEQVDDSVGGEEIVSNGTPEIDDHSGRSR